MHLGEQMDLDLDIDFAHPVTVASTTFEIELLLTQSDI
jgi:hypothetical protein